MDIAAQVQHFGPYQVFVEVLEKKIKELESQLPETGSRETPLSEKAFKAYAEQPHVDKISAAGTHSSEFYGMVHTPVTNWKKIPEAAAALEKEWQKLEKLPAWDPKQVREKSEVKAESDKSGLPVHFCRRDGPLLSQQR